MGGWAWACRGVGIEVLRVIRRWKLAQAVVGALAAQLGNGGAIRQGQVGLQVQQGLECKVPVRELAMGYECFDVAVADKIARIRMNRPEKANSMIASITGWNCS